MLCVCLSVQLAAQWLVLGSGEVSLYLQREIGLSAFLAAVQTYCLKVGHHSASSCRLVQVHRPLDCNVGLTMSVLQRCCMLAGGEHILTEAVSMAIKCQAASLNCKLQG